MLFVSTTQGSYYQSRRLTVLLYLITYIHMEVWWQEVLVWRLLTDPPRPVVKVRIFRSTRVSLSLGDSEQVPERNEMRAACTVQHQQYKSVSTWVVWRQFRGLVQLTVRRLWRDDVVYRVAVVRQCLVVHLSDLVCTHTHAHTHTIITALPPFVQ